MSHSSELVELYRSLMVRAEQRIVEGEWYVVEKEGCLPVIVSGEDKSDFGYLTEVLGYTITPVEIFRKSSDENNKD